MPKASPRLVAVIILGALVGCNQRHGTPTTGAPTAKPPKAVTDPGVQRSPIAKLDAKHLPNPVRICPKVISGGLPEGDEAFAELQSLGVKTVISVDGAKPDVARAEKHGLRYVHLPHGYDGVPEQRVAELAKAVRELPGSIYIHCHHGKHRSPAAAAVACVSVGLIESADAPAILRIAGTSEHYRGLFESANRARRLDDALLDKLPADFPSVAKLPAMAEAMVQIEHTHDHLKALEKADWKRIPHLPALEPAHEALLLREHFTELLRTEDVSERPEHFQSLLKKAETAAQSLEDALRQRWTQRASDALQIVSDNCTQCHREFRDVPLREKAHARYRSGMF